MTSGECGMNAGRAHGERLRMERGMGRRAPCHAGCRYGRGGRFIWQEVGWAAT